MIELITHNLESLIMETLYDQNEWWTLGKVPPRLLLPFKRRDFYMIRNSLKDKKILAIVGPRQVGKTIVLYQLIDWLIENGIDPKRILYNSFDFPYLDVISKTPLDDLLKTYSTYILREPLPQLKKEVFIFLDEICKLKNWSRLLKGWYDLKYPIKFIITDSSAAEILRGSSESLVGRINPSIMMPMKFSDYVQYHWEKDARKKPDIKHISLQLRNAFHSALVKRGGLKDLSGVFQEEAVSTLTPYKRILEIYLQEYVLKDGYPKLLEIKSLPDCAKELGDLLSLTLQKDLMRLFQIRNPETLNGLVYLLAYQSSSLINYQSLASTLGVRVETVRDYIRYLQHIFLVSTSEFYTRMGGSRIRKQHKIYFTNVGLRNVILGMMNERLLRNPQALGVAVETLVHEHCKRIKFNLEQGTSSDLFYWRDKKGREVDIVVELLGKPVPIEVKYKNDISDDDIKGLNAFLSKYSKTFGVVVTKDRLELRKKMIYIPLWLFLMMC